MQIKEEDDDDDDDEEDGKTVVWYTILLLLHVKRAEEAIDETLHRKASRREYTTHRQ